MCTYRNLLYMERWDTAIERCTAIYEVDVNGLPIKRVLHTRIVPSKSLQDDTGWRLRRMFVRNYSAPCLRAVNELTVRGLVG